MMLKCIGGNHDGEWQEIDGECLRIGHAHRIAKLPKLSAVVDFPQSYEEIANNITVKYSIYIVNAFYFSKDDRYWFLIPEGWTNREAMVYQFNKMTNPIIKSECERVWNEKGIAYSFNKTGWYLGTKTGYLMKRKGARIKNETKAKRLK